MKLKLCGVGRPIWSYFAVVLFAACQADTVSAPASSARSLLVDATTATSTGNVAQKRGKGQRFLKGRDGAMITFDSDTRTLSDNRGHRISVPVLELGKVEWIFDRLDAADQRIVRMQADPGYRSCLARGLASKTKINVTINRFKIRPNSVGGSITGTSMMGSLGALKTRSSFGPVAMADDGTITGDFTCWQISTALYDLTTQWNSVKVNLAVAWAAAIGERASADC